MKFKSQTCFLVFTNPSVGEKSNCRCMINKWSGENTFCYALVPKNLSCNTTTVVMILHHRQTVSVYVLSTKIMYFCQTNISLKMSTMWKNSQQSFRLLWHSLIGFVVTVKEVMGMIGIKGEEPGEGEIKGDDPLWGLPKGTAKRRTRSLSLLRCSSTISSFHLIIEIDYCGL